MRHSILFSSAALAGLVLLARPARAGDSLQIVGQPTLDPPTITALGVQLLISDDDNYSAKVTVRYRKTGESGWRDALPLHRVHPDVVVGYSVPPQFAGSIFDLAPATSYDIELHAVDADGSVDKTLMITGSTRGVPALDPKTPNMKPVTDVASLNTALSAAKPGDVILLKNGTYAGQFAINASGTAADPIVIRGESEDGTILDGGGAGGNVLEVYGSFVHVERMTIQNANRALRFQGMAAEANVVRRVHIKDVTLGIGSKPDQKDFYICDNILEGRLKWPAVYWDDGGVHANDDGINVEGNGHVVCHNQLYGFGDAMKIEQDGARSVDFYNNDVLSAYDNGLELDASSGNTRALRNRFTNSYATISFQPIYGGPAYAIRNVVVNVANEQLKVHALGTVPPQEPSGIYVLHNTFVSQGHALSNQTSDGSHHIILENNLFIGPDMPASGKTVDWTGPLDDATFDYNGYYPEGEYAFNLAGQGYQKFPNFAAVQAAGLEKHGLLVGQMNFASGLVPPSDYKTELMPSDPSLSPGSMGVDKGVVLANVNEGYAGAAPDLGALEIGCPAPIYGPRPEGMDETNEAICSGGSNGSGGGSPSAGSGMPSGASSGAGGGGSSGGDKGGCGCREAGAVNDAGAGASLALVAMAIGLVRRQRRRGAGRRQG